MVRQGSETMVDKLPGTLRTKDVLVSAFAGTGQRRIAAQHRTLTVYAAMYVLGLYAFTRFTAASIRAFGIGMLFPGAGLTTVSTLPSLISFVVTILAFAASLVMWLAAGALVLPIFVWIGSALLAGLLAKGDLVKPVGFFWAIVCPGLVMWIRVTSVRASATAVNRREQRNEYLPSEVKRILENAPNKSQPGQRELDLRTLRFVQWVVELGLLPEDDWSRHTIIDQFQTAALRYQLYQTVYSLQVYQCHYAPNYSGALRAACRNALIKAQCEKVNSFWKWECMGGKLNFSDWDPIKKDNIMVTGYITLALALYDANTRDHFFREKSSMEFVVTKNCRYKTDFPSIAKAVFDNMNQSGYTLFPCEPHWIYTPCNLFGAAGLVTTDRALGTNYMERLRTRLAKSVEEEFSEPDGSLLPIRSSLTGFAIPGGVGIANESINSVLCRPVLPHVAQRCWAVGRKETVTYNDQGDLSIALKHGDTVDPGNYKHSEGVSRVLCAQAAAEHGDRQLRDDCLHQLDTIYHPVQTTASGSLFNKGLSTFIQGRALEARLLDCGDWLSMTKTGVPEICFSGPLLAHAPFPDVLVAKAWSHDGVGLELVLYNGGEPGEFELQFERLRLFGSYRVENGMAMTADELGKGALQAMVDGRTRLVLRLED